MSNETTTDTENDDEQHDTGIERPVCMGVDLSGTPSHERTKMQAQRRNGEWLWRCQSCGVMIKPTDTDPSEAHGEVR